MIQQPHLAAIFFGDGVEDIKAYKMWDSVRPTWNSQRLGWSIGDVNVTLLTLEFSFLPEEEV